jgi:HEAT repeat protein
MKLIPALLVAGGILCPFVNAADALYVKADTMLQEALADKNPNTRRTAVVALSLAASRNPYLSRLIGMLEDKDAEVRLAAVSSLSEVENKAVTAALRKALAARGNSKTFWT